MKTKNIIKTSVAAALLVLAACTNDHEPGYAPAKEIRVDASIGQMTRVTTDGNESAFEPGDRISVYAWLGADNDMQRLVVDNSINTLGGDGTWTAEPQMLWADNTSDHYFLGIYPERNGATDYDADPYTLDFNNQTASDLLVARTTAKPTGSAVKLEFEHVMAKLVVNLSFRNEWTTAPEVASVTATACTEATVNYLENPVEVTPATGQNLVVIPFTGTSASFAGIMIPGQSGFRTINVTLENGKVYTYTHPSGIDLQPGRYTTVNLVLGRDNIKLDDAGINVSDWENGTSIDGAEATEAYSYDSNTKTITIYSGEGLKVAADVANSGDTDINIILDNDIDLTGIDWTPIGTESRPYTGNFDGGGHTITGLKIDKSGTDYVGLIGCLGSGGKVQNVTLTNISVSGANCVGGIAGQNYGTVENCSVNGTVTGKGFTDTGGIAGSNYGTISGCSAEGTVTGSVNVGGIAGGSYLGVIIDGCHSTAAVSGISSVGGVVGNLGNNSFLMACYSTGNVTATITYGYAHVGGVVGINGQGTVTACYHATGEITSLGEGRIGGIVGENYIGTVAACYWENNLSSGTGSNNGRDDTHKVEGTDVTWQTAVAAMNTALQSAGSGWHYVLNGALPTLEEK
ncbi:fimbrillin family protein [Phocaeicola plebeius]|uniref:fimbrillin family protein n=1 Tax=Phocaeicola plebeius TaxID=310297 RepID=UPI0021AC3869|nr:fimbrillin family protein [Phocaeicola plebeius]MCR8882660.1 fimbrillin family protein [Phocaeicola plebeius]MDM8285824.1 fimbrillin family protein [Phocaeicola plebeius]